MFHDPAPAGAEEVVSRGISTIRAMQHSPRRKMNRATIFDRLKVVNSAPRHGAGSFVGAIYDTSSQDADLPVAVVIGINYGQLASSASVVGSTHDDIRYARYVKVLTGREHHAVIWNFYPYLTAKEWTKDAPRAVDEASRVFDTGFVDPIAAFEALIRELQPDLIIFHGIVTRPSFR
jgi:hypothetical protein